MEKCPKNFIKIPPIPKMGIHPCSGCQHTYYLKNNPKELTCDVYERQIKSEV